MRSQAAGGPLADAEGAENLCHLGKGLAERGRAFGMGGAGLAWSWADRMWDDLRLAGVKLICLIVSGAVSLGFLRREAWWKDAEILMLRHQLAVAGRDPT